MSEGISRVSPEEIEASKVTTGAKDQYREGTSKSENEIMDALSPVSEKSMDLELTPELIDIIMAKVQDINRDGVAFSATYSDYFSNVIREGFLGTDDEPHPKDKEERSRNWIKNARNRNIKENLVWFNITGRSAFGENPFKTSCYASWDGFITIIFDLTRFREISGFAHRDWNRYSDVYKKEFGKTIVPATRTFSVNQFNSSLNQEFEIEPFEVLNQHTDRNERGVAENDSNYGFMASCRISPVLFQGIVIGENDRGIIDALVDEMRQVNNPNRMLPIYDRDGNLLWPQEMSNEQVKELAEERNTEVVEDKIEQRKLWEDKIRVAAKLGTMKAINDFQFPGNIGEIIPNVLAEEGIQRQLAKIFIFETLAGGRYDKSYVQWVEQFNINIKHIHSIINENKDEFIERHTSLLKNFDSNQHWTFIESLLEVLQLNIQESRELFCVEPFIEMFFSSCRDLEEWQHTCYSLKRVFKLNEDELEDIITRPKFNKFIHERFVLMHGHVPPLAKFLAEKYGVNKSELRKKSSKKAVYAIANHIFDTYSAFPANDYLEVFPPDIFNDPANQEQFLNTFETNLGTTKGWGRLARSPREYFELMKIDHVKYFSSQRFHDVIIKHVLDRYSYEGKVKNKHYHEKLDKYFKSLNMYVGEGLSFDRNVYEKEAGLPDIST